MDSLCRSEDDLFAEDRARLARTGYVAGPSTGAVAAAPPIPGVKELPLG